VPEHGGPPGKKIIYLPLGTLSPVTLKKIRQFHVLDGHGVRRIRTKNGRPAAILVSPDEFMNPVLESR
jgi:hypothetical protein